MTSSREPAPNGEPRGADGGRLARRVRRDRAVPLPEARVLPARRFARLGATPDFHDGLLPGRSTDDKEGVKHDVDA
jgi:hypothetical protein